MLSHGALLFRIFKMLVYFAYFNFIIIIFGETETCTKNIFFSVTKLFEKKIHSVLSKNMTIKQVTSENTIMSV